MMGILESKNTWKLLAANKKDPIFLRRKDRAMYATSCDEKKVDENDRCHIGSCSRRIRW